MLFTCEFYRESREKKRAEEEMLRLKKKEEEWARKREFEEARKKEREEKLKQLQEAQDNKQKQAASTGINPLDIVKVILLHNFNCCVYIVGRKKNETRKNAYKI